jgi:hypothetical protein
MRRALGALLMALGVTLAPAVRADAKEDAAAAYDRGAAAYDRGEFGVASRELARADELAPNPVALELAILASVRTDDAPLGMTLLERARERRGVKASVQREARRALAPKVGKLDVRCPAAASRCDVVVDGARFEPGGPRFVAVGTHKVTVTLARGSDARPPPAAEELEVVIESGKTVEVLPPLAPESSPSALAPSPSPSPAPRTATPARAPEAKDASGGGLGPIWFWIGLGATVVVSGGAVVSGIDTASKHDAFLRDRSDAAAADAGRAADQRTIFLVGTSAVLAVGTALLGLVFVDWKKGAGGRT